MADLTFSQPERRNLLLPIGIAVVVLVAAAALVLAFLPRRTADLTVTHVATWQAHTVYKSDSIVVGKDAAQDDLYVLITLRIDDQLKIPLFLKDFTATFTNANGETFETGAAEKNDLDALYTVFPALKALASPPLLREATVAPGQPAEGMILLQLPMKQDAWDHRKAATLTVDFYHQGPQTIAIPAGAPAAK